MPDRRALVVCPESPYPVIGGGALRTASIVEYLSRTYEVDLVIFREPGAPDPRRHSPRDLARKVHVIELPFHSKAVSARLARNALRALRGVAPLSDRFAGFASEIERCLRGERYDVAFIEHFWCAQYAEVLSAHADTTVLDLHNIDSALLAGYARTERWPARLLYRRFASACACEERRWFSRFRRLLVTSEEDRRRALALSPGADVHVYPNSMPLVAQPCVEEQQAIAFSGNLEYQPNISAVRFFAREVWPALAARHPSLVWRIIGKNPHGILNCVTGLPRVEVTGPVDDAIACLAACSLVLVPVVAGSGTRLKILEAWAAGRAVVSTRLGAEGLHAVDGEHVILCEKPQEFLTAICRLLDGRAERARIGAAGRALYERRFTWPKSWEILQSLGI